MHRISRAAGCVWLALAAPALAGPAPLPANAHPTAIGVDGALAVAAARVPGVQPRVRREVQTVAGQPREVWLVHHERGLPGSPWSAPVARIDVHTGVLLDIQEGALHVDGPPQAYAYPRNPALDPEPLLVELPDAASGLSDDRLELRQCADLRERTTWWIGGREWPIHMCTEVAAAGPTDGDYLFDPVPYAPDPARDEDDFVAAHTYWNLHRGLTWFDELGWVTDLDPYLEVVVNQREPDLWSEETATDRDGPLVPYNNAYFTGMYDDWSGEWVHARMVFGQGTYVDYAYDADVILHELAHYIFRSVGGPSYADSSTRYGPSVAARAINEGLADYWSSVIQGDPLLAEYAGSDGSIREVDGHRRCGRDSVGEPHYDGMILAQGLWTARQDLSEPDQRAFDGAVLAGIPQLAEPASMEDAAAVFTALVTEQVGPDAGAALQAELEDRGMFDCVPVIDVSPSDDPFRSYQRVDGSWEFLHEGAMPAPVQQRIEVPEGGAQYVVTFVQGEYLGLDLYGQNKPLPLQVVGRNKRQLKWTQDLVETELEIEGVPYTTIVERWSHNGEWLAETRLVASETTEDGRARLHTYEAVLTLAEGPWVWQLVNPHERYAIVTELTFDEAPPPDGPPGPYRPQSSHPAPEVASCGCGPAWPSTPWGAGALLLVLAARRRSRAVRA